MVILSRADKNELVFKKYKNESRGITVIAANDFVDIIFLSEKKTNFKFP